MNTTIPMPPARYLAAMGVALLAAFALVVARPMLLGSGDETTGAPATAPPVSQKPHGNPTRPQAQPRVALLPGLPAKVANKLRYSNVVVVALYQGNARADRSAVAASAAGARAVRAGFLPLNVLNEKAARSVQSFVGTTPTPAAVVVKRPGRIVARLEGAASADEQLVAQAALNAGARRR